MAGKKGSVANDAFLKQYRQTAQGAAKEVRETLEKVSVRSVLDGGKKNLEYRDVFDMTAAPGEWNRYPLLKEDQPDRYLELKMSIYEKGVSNPLILWERRGGLIILSGHNRKAICVEILEECRDEKNFDEKKFRYPPCIVYEEDEITEEQAREIIDDTNLYRDFSKLPSKVKIEITKDRMEVYKRRRYSKGERIDQLAKELGLEKTAIYENLNIYEKVIQPLQELYYSEILTRKSVIRFLFFDADTQQWIYDTYKGAITDAKVKALKKNMNRAEIARVFESDGRGIKKVTLDVPADRVGEFKEIYARWMKGEITLEEQQEAR